MRLQSHIVTLSEKDEDNNLKTFKLESDGDTQHITVCNDFIDNTNTPTALSIGTLIDLLYQSLGKGYLVPTTHQTAWTAINQSVGNLKEAYGYSQSLMNIEMAKPGSLAIEFKIGTAGNGGDESPVIINVADALLPEVDYHQVIRNISQYRHAYDVIGDVLKITMDVSPKTYTHAEELATALVTKDGCYRVKLVRDEQLYYEVVFPRYLVDDISVIHTALVENLPDTCKLDDIASESELTINAPVGMNVVLNSVYFTLSTLEA